LIAWSILNFRAFKFESLVVFSLFFKQKNTSITENFSQKGVLTFFLSFGFPAVENYLEIKESIKISNFCF